MGEVYRARDTRLERIVAIKVLPTHLSERPDLKERFDREAKAISSLNHPHICALYDVGHQDGVDFLVMEYLEGETLADRLLKEPLPTEDVLKVGLQVAEALDKAHRSGVVHRDLKPGNVMLTREGVKLLDFGLAKLGDLSAKPGSGSLPGLTGMPTAASPQTPLTQAGTILGTFQYMSPEQLEGKEADTRSDIFAFGGMLYEMATGRRAFEGESQASLIAAIMGKEPRPISEIIALSPPALDRVVRICLAKDPEKRWQTAHDVALQLEWIAEGGSQAGVPAPVAARRRHRERLAWVIGGVGIAAAAAMAVLFFLSRTPPETQVLRFHIPTPPGTQNFADPRISPDGSMISFLAADSTGTNHVWIQRLSALDAQTLPGTEDARTPFWSPDSRYLAYFTTDEKLKKINVSGGPPQTLAATPGADGWWGASGIILFDNSATDSVKAIAATGGVPTPATTIDRARGESGNGWPYFMPDGKHFLFMSLGNRPEDTVLKTGSLGSMESKILGPVGSRFEYAPTGHLLYVKDGILMARAFDAKKMEYTGEPVPVSEGVAAGGAFFEGDFSVSRNGILVYWEGNVGTNSRLVWVDRAGHKLETVGEVDRYGIPTLSPDEARLLVQIEDPRASTADLWLIDLHRGTQSRFTFDPGDDGPGVWSPDQSRVVFASSPGSTFPDLYMKRASGAGSPEPFLETPEPKTPSDWSRDGEWIVYYSFFSATRLDVMAIPASGKGKPITVAGSEFFELNGKLSPDGKWIAYQSNESGGMEVYVQAFPQADGKWQVSTAGGAGPAWRGDGKELYYLALDQTLMAVDVDTQAGFEAGIPHALFKAEVSPSTFRMNRYLPSEDGQRFLLHSPASIATSPPLTVVVNWAEELKQR